MVKVKSIPHGRRMHISVIYVIHVRAQCVVRLSPDCDASGTDNQTPPGHGNSIC